MNATQRAQLRLQRREAGARTATDRAIDVFTTPAVRLSDRAAEILAEHAAATLEGFEHLGNTELAHWGSAFLREHPACARELHLESADGFAAALKLYAGTP